MPKTTSIPTDLIRIIAEVGSRLPRQYDDHIAVALLKYLQAQAAEAKQAIPSLDLYFSGKYPAIDLGQHIVNALHNAHPELQKPDVRRMTEEEYRAELPNQLTYYAGTEGVTTAEIMSKYGESFFRQAIQYNKVLTNLVDAAVIE